ncbi:putative gyf domain-containing protein [Phaeoacremonium minimum UCRPA7]|uniref:Putative gyf domain-containing protein n=1 Tax=Phaeoacremonium minimum (strain UCR-PA7) TaxID=1286976 RepID=R8BL90_PHAM7|nr:putative gyf domain-containing protein [Phaeoacremonium minimum UCRPA7]EOO00166.1 putative gyf domain-containing protein [Phaeoacremonium minimum UCRPA7]
MVDESEEDIAASRELPAKPGPLGGLMRSNTSGSTGFAGASAWGASATAPAPPSGTSGLGAFGNFSLPASNIGDKRFGSTRGESRLAHLLPKDSSENIAGKAGEGAVGDVGRSWRARPRTDTDPFGGDDNLSGSAVLGADRDVSPPPLSYDTPVKGSAGDFGMSGLHLGGDEHGTASPSQTNPYRSPPAERSDNERDEAGFDKMNISGTHAEHASNFGSIGRGFPANTFDGSDRSQTSSVGAKGYPALGNIGWPTGPSTSTPDRDRPGFANPFGSSLFSPIGDLQSPSLGGLGGMFGPASAGGLAGSGSIRGSKLGSLFPAAMQAQMQSQDQESLGDSVPDLRQTNPLGAIGRGAIGSQVRDTDSPMRAGRGAFEELFASSESARSPGVFTTGEQNPALTATATQSHGFTPATSGAPGFPAGLPATADLPPSQARTMVMPDRMRWVYLDPQGQMQGPFTGLEMNDWYKANFFTADLRVKKIEDTEFEPLGQLIRRIGNSREPFLVPQIGIPHGPPSAAGPFSAGDARGVIPPLMGVIPSFGRTLTAEEQNNLERRKQEEQYMMARQREYLAQQQALAKMQIQAAGGGSGALHHHSSAHSLQSQPSFGSMTSPIGMPPQPPIGAIGPTPGFFEQPSNMSQGSGQGGPEALHGELSDQERQMLAGIHGPSGISGMYPSQPVGAPSADVRSQLPGVDQLHKDSQGFRARLKEFQEIRAQRDAEEAQAGPLGVTGSIEEEPESAANAAQAEAADIIREVTRLDGSEATQKAVEQALSLTQQVQQTQAAAAAAKQVQADEAWAKQAAASGLPMPFPPPPPSSTTPLPAPTAQRRSNIPDQYAGSRSQSETPDSAAAHAVAAQPPPLAPWAREPGSEAQKGPSLKEIQEAEAKKAAKAEEAAAAARRAALEQEAAAAREREKISVVNPGLPTTSTWGSGSPVSITTAASPWAKPGAAKTAVAAVTGAATVAAGLGKKTLADIQREEEVRKQKARELATQSGSAPVASNLGKRYADLAGKSGAPPGLIAGAAPGTAAATTSGWATVGAGGKVKVPTGPAAQARTATAANIKPVSSPTVRPAVKPAIGVAKSDVGGVAMEEFSKWLHRELGRGITGGIDIDTFASTLLILPLDQQIISEAVYANSTTMDGRHFAEEFIRRKKLADKGVVEKQPTPINEAKSSSTGGGWSEVAKKGGPSSQVKENDAVGAAGFKVVPGRKKGKK